jgi:hypothetical protein
VIAESVGLYWALVFVHVVAFAYWLGGDFGVYVCARYVARPDLPIAERFRFLDALLTIDILPRSGIVLLPVLGFQIAAMRGAFAAPEWLRLLVWVLGAAWLALVWAVFLRRGTALGERLQQVDVALRVVLIGLLLAAGVASLVRNAPVVERWLALKLVTYAMLLALGLYLRTVIKGWRGALLTLRRLAAEAREGQGSAAPGAPGSPAASATAGAEAAIADGMRRGRRGAWLFWALIALTAYLGVAKPF